MFVSVFRARPLVWKNRFGGRDVDFDLDSPLADLRRELLWDGCTTLEIAPKTSVDTGRRAREDLEHQSYLEIVPPVEKPPLVR